jgi:hypothetical protein
MTTRVWAIGAMGAGAIVALGLLSAPARADAQKVYVDCLGEHAVELCTGSLETKSAPGETAKPPSFDRVLAACAAERVAFVDLVTTRNLAAGRTAAYAEKRVVRNTRRLDRMVHRLFDQCMDTRP